MKYLLICYTILKMFYALFYHVRWIRLDTSGEISLRVTTDIDIHHVYA